MTTEKTLNETGIGHPGRRDDVATLAAAIAADRAVVFVGAGASASSSIPTWGQLLKRCLEFAHEKGHRVEQAGIRFDQGDYLVAAELLERALVHDELPKFISKLIVVDPPLEPSSIHWAIARLPFRVVITTNFDKLLEQVYQGKNDATPLTWKDTEEVFKRTRDRQFFILKSHGDISRSDSLVLTRSHFRDQMSKQRDLYNEALRTILLGNMILFVGHSLRDLDLLHMMDDLVGRFGRERFGPHFAILPESEVDQQLEDYLEQSFNIKLLTFANWEFPDVTETNSRTQSVTNLLNTISGEVAKIRSGGAFNLHVDEKYYLAKTCEHILKQACETLGASEGAICLTLQKSVRRLQYVALLPRGSRKSPGDDVSHESDLGGLFLHRRMEGDWLIVDDLDERQEPLYLDHSQVGVRSRLACPIHCDGHREGVISVESKLPHAFTQQHVLALTQVARWVGIALFEARQRILTADLLLPYTQNIKKFLEMLRYSRVLNDVDIQVILYKLRYVEGNMEAVSLLKTKSGTKFVQPFGGRSLASLVLENRTPIDIPDAQDELKLPNSRLEARGVKEFGISGPVVGVPVRAKGYTAGVLVAWKGNHRPSSWWQYVPEKLQRMANLIANDPWLWDRSSTVCAENFLKGLNDRLYPIDGGKPWGQELLKKYGPEITRVLSEALLDFAEIKRVRIWQRARVLGHPLASELYVCVSSVARDAKGTPEYDTYAGKATWSDDPYCQYTIRRFEHDPYARTQHKSMFGKVEDPNSAMLEKDRDGSWKVGPVVGGARQGERRLLGYLSADNHVWTKKGWVDQVPSPELRNFQRYAVDIVTDLLRLNMIRAVNVSKDPPFTIRIWKGKQVRVQTKEGDLRMPAAGRAGKAASAK